MQDNKIVLVYNGNPDHNSWLSGCMIGMEQPHTMEMFHTHYTARPIFIQFIKIRGAFLEYFRKSLQFPCPVFKDTAAYLQGTANIIWCMVKDCRIRGNKSAFGWGGWRMLRNSSSTQEERGAILALREMSKVRFHLLHVFSFIFGVHFVNIYVTQDFTTSAVTCNFVFQ